MPRPTIPAFFGILSLFIIGCGTNEVGVHGKVTANGKDLEEGNIAFHPADGKNSSHGAEIKNGQYSVKIGPGKYTVVVSGGAKAPVYPKTQEELKKIADKDLAAIGQDVPADAKGNNQQLDITGAREFNIALEFPTQQK